MTRQWAGKPGTDSQCGQRRDFLSSQCTDQLWDHSTFYPMGTGSYFPRYTEIHGQLRKIIKSSCKEHVL